MPKELRAAYIVDSTGVDKGLDKASKGFQKLDSDAKRYSESFDSHASKIGGAFTALGTTLGGFGIPFTESISKIGEHLDDAKAKGTGYGQVLSDVGGVAAGALTAGLVGAGVEAVNLADKFGSATGQLASQGEISAGAATKIGDAFKGIKGEENATELTAAYAQVAGQLGQVAGHALGTKEAVGVMTAAADLADAKMGSLTSTTSDLAGVMTAYGLSADQAGKTSGTLFGIATKTGESLDSVTQTVERLHSTLGATTPPLAQVGGLIADLQEHGETGKQAISAVSSAMTTLLKQTPPTTASAKDLTAQQTALAKANLAVQAAQEKYNNSLVGTKDLTAQQTAVAKANLAVQVAQEKYDNSLTSGSTSAQAAASAGLAKAKLNQTQAEDRLNQAMKPGSSDALTKAKLDQAQAEDRLNQAMKPTPEKLSASETEAKKLGITVFDSSGKFVGMQSVIAQLQPKLKGMTEAQQLQATSQLFGATAAQKMLDVVLAGPQAYDKATAAVSKADTAHTAAQAQMKTLHGETKELAATLENEGITIGTKLIPVVEKLAEDTADVINWFERHKDAAIALGAVIGGALSIAVGAFTVNKISGMISGVGQAAHSLESFAGTTTQVASTVLQKLGLIDSETGSKMTSIGQKWSSSGQNIQSSASQTAGKVEATTAGMTAQVEADTTAMESGQQKAITEGSVKVAAAAEVQAGEVEGSAAAMATSVEASTATMEVGEAAAITAGTGAAVAAAEAEAAAVGESFVAAAGPALLAALVAEQAAKSLPGASKVPEGAQGVENVTSKIPIAGPLGDAIGNSLANALGLGGTQYAPAKSVQGPQGPVDQGPGFASLQRRNVAHAAQGAIVRRPTLLVAGESGDELIVPMSGLTTDQPPGLRYASAGSGGAVNGTNITLNLTLSGPGIIYGTYGQVAAALAPQLRQELIKIAQASGTSGQTL